MALTPIKIQRKSIERILVQGKRTAVVQLKSRSHTVSVVQSASPIPISTGEVADPGDLNLIFDNKLI